MAIVPAYSAVIAIIAAVAADLDQAANENLLPEMLLAKMPRTGCGILDQLRSAFGNQTPKLHPAQTASHLQFL
jgi:hypothetical protein